MRRLIIPIFLLCTCLGELSAQNIEGGLLLGNTQYFGDLNPKARFNAMMACPSTSITLIAICT